MQIIGYGTEMELEGGRRVMVTNVSVYVPHDEKIVLPRDEAQEVDIGKCQIKLRWEPRRGKR